ncbi:hypothetical protein [uncultured Cedecea sp.]|uniref:hypothetical protein n=1 Tax=uncultured Cedecea sp. TaxID=988762 RepID=UPI00260D3E32|nr:hypothetical protein [uncultured Cedecea sp.]
MSIKSQFLKKLQARHPAPVPAHNKSQADIAAFALRMEQLQQTMDEWLQGTGLTPETQAISVTDLLVEGGTFHISGVVLRYEERAVRFMPLYLYGQGVTGCVEVTLHMAGHVTPLGRLFMRSGNIIGDWVFTPPDTLPRAGQRFDENTFFELILALLP